MRNYVETIRQAELQVSSPEAVAAYLKERAKRITDNRHSYEGDEQMELALLARNHPLIDLALAQYCRHAEIAHQLFFREPTNPTIPLRLAVLTNRIVGTYFKDFPNKILSQDNGGLPANLAAFSDEELLALFENPHLNDYFLRDFLTGGKCWQAMSEEKRQIAVHGLSKNERMRAPYDGDMDGDVEYSYEAVFDAAWKLSETAPTTTDWAFALGRLYEHLLPMTYSVKNPLEIAARWQNQDADTKERESERVEMVFLDEYQEVRKALAKLALQREPLLAATLLGSEDVAFRAAPYTHADLKVEQITEAYEKDGELAFNHMVHNRYLWRISDKREALREIAWAVAHNDKHSDLIAPNIYNDIHDNFAKEYPDWFRNEDEIEDEDTPEPSDEPATKADKKELASVLTVPFASTEHIKNVLDAIYNRLGFVLWFSFFILVGVFYRYY